ncbi:MAG: xanthine dehydrogenase family protein subunit M [Chloroflexota bacterium]
MDMKPAPFEYIAPRTLDEAVTALSQGGEDAKLLAGGQSLVPLLNFRLARPTLLVDLNRVSELAFINERADGVAIGAMTRQATLERDASLARAYPLLAEALGWVGHRAIRSRGTFGGSLAHADPAAELPAVAVCLDAQITVRGPNRQRVVRADDFFQGYLTTALNPDEILVDTWLPAPTPATGQAWTEFARRHGDFALVGVGVSLTMADKDHVASARIVLTGVGGRPFRAREAETLLVGGTLDERIGAAADAVRSAIDPDSDIHATKEYRAHLAAVLTERAIRTAQQRALVQATPVSVDIRRSLDALSRHA